MGSRDRDHAHFSEIFVRGHVGTIPGNTPAKFEVRTFSRFGADRLTDRQEQAYQKRQRGYWLLPVPDTGHHFQLIIYSVQCCYAVHWTDNN